MIFIQGLLVEFKEEILNKLLKHYTNYQFFEVSLEACAGIFFFKEEYLKRFFTKNQQNDKFCLKEQS